MNIDTDSEQNPTPDQTNPGHQRRPRYRGTHPRRFEEKYKEHAPEQYPGLVRKVIESGKTPAGMHRPICVNEIMDLLAPAPGLVAVDATLGYGGHAQALLEKLRPGGRLIGLDTDPFELPKTVARLRAAGFGESEFEAHQTNYAGLARLLGRLGIDGVDVVLADLGCSAMQLDDPNRGFSFKRDGPLDLRMNPRKGFSAADWLRTVSVSVLEEALRENADEPRAALLAVEIVARSAREPAATTMQLARWIDEILRTSGVKRAEERESAMRRVFQAIRIVVNDEFAALETFLRFLPPCLKYGGRAALLTFHSGEDRRVKRAFEAGLAAGLYADVACEVGRPSADEIRANPRAASAKLRWAVRAP